MDKHSNVENRVPYNLSFLPDYTDLRRLREQSRQGSKSRINQLLVTSVRSANVYTFQFPLPLLPDYTE
jgi:hypothetical protein